MTNTLLNYLLLIALPLIAFIAMYRFARWQDRHIDAGLDDEIRRAGQHADYLRQQGRGA